MTTDRRKTARAVELLRHVVCEGGPDMATSRADARIALCIAKGVSLEDIDSSLGYDISDRAYHHVRASHVRNLREQPGSEYAERDARWGHALWLRHRPDLAEGDDWCAAAHRTGDET
jgi:hypothetical protein